MNSSSNTSARKNRIMQTMCALFLIVLLVGTCTASFTEELPAELTVIEDEAFCGNELLDIVILPESTTTLGSRAFADCPNLEILEIPAKATTVPMDLLEGSDKVCVYLYENTSAHKTAKAAGWDYYLLNGAPAKPVWGADGLSPLEITPSLQSVTAKGVVLQVKVCLPGIADATNIDGFTIHVIPQHTTNGIFYDCSILTNEGDNWYSFTDTFSPACYDVYCSYYRVIDGTIYTSEWSKPGCFIIPGTSTLTGSISSITNEQNNEYPAVQLSWTAAENVDEYHIKRTGSDGSSYSLTFDGNSTSCLDSDIQGGVSYTYSLCAISKNNNSGVPIWSGTSTFTIDIPPQHNLIQYLQIDGDKTVAGGGKSLQLTVSYEPTDNVAPGLIWTSSDPAVASINAAGLITTAAQVADDKPVTFTCTATDGSGLIASHTVTVLNNRSYSNKNYNIYNISNTSAYMNAWPDTMNGVWKSLLGTSKNDSSAEEMFVLEPVVGTYDQYRIRVMEYGGMYINATTSGATICSLDSSMVFKVIPTGSNVCFVTTDESYALTLGGIVSSSYSHQNFVYLSTYTGSTAQQWCLAVKNATLTTNISSINLYENATSTITAYITSDGSDNKAPLQFTSSNTNVATVSTTGLVTAKTVGSASITVSTPGGISKVIPVTVSKKDTSNLPVIQWKSSAMSINENLAFTIPLTVTGYTGRFPVSLTVSDPTLDIISCKFTDINQTLIQLGQSGSIFQVNGGFSVSTVKPNSTSRRFFATGENMSIYLGGSYQSSKGNRTVTLTLNDPSDSSYVVGANRTLTLTLADVDSKRPDSKSGYTRSEYVAACLPWLAVKYPSGAAWNHPIGTVNNDNHITNSICSDAHTSTNGIRSTSWCDGTLSVYQGSTICNANQSYNSAQCMGFALKVASDVFGSTPGVGNGWTKYSSYSSAGGFQPGDYVRVTGHSFFVTGIEGQVVKVLHCNYKWGGTKYSCGIVRTGDANWTNSYSTITHWQNQGIEAIYRYTGW